MNDRSWDSKPAPSIHLRVTAAVGPESRVAVNDIYAPDGHVGAHMVEIEGLGYSTVSISLGVGWAPDEDQVAAANLLIAAFTDARDRAQARMDAALAVPA